MLKLSSIIIRSPEGRAAALRHSWRNEAPTCTRPPTMLRSISPAAATAADVPRDCVMFYRVGPCAVLLVSYDASGDVFEEFRTRPDLVTSEMMTRMLARVREHGVPTLRVI